MGGKPGASTYIIGVQSEKAFYLDPHDVQTVRKYTNFDFCTLYTFEIVKIVSYFSNMNQLVECIIYWHAMLHLDFKSAINY